MATIIVKGTPEGYQVLSDDMVYETYASEREAEKVASDLRRVDLITSMAEQLIADAIDSLREAHSLSFTEAIKYLKEAL